MRFTSEGFANAKVMPSLMGHASPPSMGLANPPSMGLANPPTCGPNQTHDKWGNCICNPGYIMNGSIDYTTGTLKCVKNDCVSTGGYIDKNGKCACSIGHSLNNYGTCMVNPDPNGCNSKQMMAPDSNGICVCSNPPCAVKLSDNSSCAYIGSPCNKKTGSLYGQGGYISLYGQGGYIQKDGTCGKSPASCF